MILRLVGSPAVLVAALVLASSALIAASPPPLPDQHSSGVKLLGPMRYDARPQPLSPALARAWSAALDLAATHPTDLGYPSTMRSNGAVTVAVVTAGGQRALEDWVRAGAQTTGSKVASIARPEVPIRTRTVKYSYKELEAIKDDATFLVEAGLPDASTIYASESDYDENRVIITVDRLSDQLVMALAQRYGTDAIAVRVDPTQGRPTELRHFDSPPFWGGAILDTPLGNGACTSAFAWGDSTYKYMLTAGHCGPTGGSYYTPASNMGTVFQSTHENWNAGTGTVYLTYFSGDSTYRGDVSLIRVETSPSTIDEKIYRGTANTESGASVKEMWWGAPTAGDQFCQGGAYTGELCAFSVTAGRIRFHIQYASGNWARGVTEGTKSRTCLQSGDSGGPVYTVRADAGIAAKGVLSAMWLTSVCQVYFTDMNLLWEGLPGGLQTE